MEPDEKGQAIIGLALVSALLSHLDRRPLDRLVHDPFVIQLRAFQASLEDWLERGAQGSQPHLRQGSQPHLRLSR